MISFYIGEVMRKRTEELAKDRTAARAIKKLQEPDTDLIVVTNEGDPVGVFSYMEVVKLIDDQKDVSEITLAECSLSPVVTVEESENVETAAAIMEENGLWYLLVTKANDIIGYLSDRDITEALSDISDDELSKE